MASVVLEGLRTEEILQVSAMGDGLKVFVLVEMMLSTTQDVPCEIFRFMDPVCVSSRRYAVSSGKCHLSAGTATANARWKCDAAVPLREMRLHKCNDDNYCNFIDFQLVSLNH